MGVGCNACHRQPPVVSLILPASWEQQHGSQAPTSKASLRGQHGCSGLGPGEGWIGHDDPSPRAGKLAGTIEIGQGSFRWMPAHGKLGLKRIP